MAKATLSLLVNMLPSISIPFTLNENSIRWLDENIPSIVKTFDDTNVDTGGLAFYNLYSVPAIKFRSTPPALQLTSYLNSLGLTDVYAQMFIYKVRPNLDELVKQTPHIDTYTDVHGTTHVIGGRINVLYDGPENSKMHWWNIELNDPLLHTIPIEDGAIYKPLSTNTATPVFKSYRVQVIGNSLKEQFANIKEPAVTVTSLSVKGKTADIIRTDILHCVERDGHRRVVISAHIRHSWEYIVSRLPK